MRMVHTEDYMFWILLFELLPLWTNAYLIIVFTDSDSAVDGSYDFLTNTF